MPDPLKHPAESGDKAGVLVRDDQPDPVQTPLLQGAEEPTPKHFVFGIADVQAEDLPATVRSDGRGDDHRHRGDLPTHTRACAGPSAAGAADMQVGGVQEHVGKRGVVQRPVPEGGYLLVQSGADPRHFGLRDTGPDP